MFSTSKNNASKAWSSRIMSKLGYSKEEWDKSSKYHSRIGRQFFSPFTSSLLSGSTILHNNKWRTKVLTSWGSLNSAGMSALLHSKTELKAHAKNDRSKKKERQNPKLIPKANKHDLPHSPWLISFFVCLTLEQWGWINIHYWHSTSCREEQELLQHQPSTKEKAAGTLVEMLVISFQTSLMVPKTETEYKHPVSCFRVVELVNEDLSSTLGLTSAVPWGKRMPDWEQPS